MAQRYGGKYSPGSDAAGPSGPLGGRTPRRMGARVNLLFAAPFLVALTAFGRDPVGLAFGLGGFGLMMLSAWLTREGLRAEDAFNARTIARPPALPRKMLGSAAMGAGLALAGLAADPGVVAPAIYAALGAALHFAAFGPDPLRAKGLTDENRFQSDRVARVVDEAERHLNDMTAAIAPLKDRRLTDRVARFTAAARAMCRTVEDDPRDLTGARRYLGVYLIGARDAARRFAELYARRRDDAARTEFEALLDDLEQTFAARTQKMLTDDRLDLDVEIGVLRERLAREGIKTE